MCSRKAFLDSQDLTAHEEDTGQLRNSHEQAGDPTTVGFFHHVTILNFRTGPMTYGDQLWIDNADN